MTRALGCMVLLLGVVGTGCEATPAAGTSCTRPSDCAAPLVCGFGRCRVACVENRDCSTGATCLTQGGAGTCSLDTDLGCETGVGRECSAGLTCVGDRCAATCTSASDCPVDGRCEMLSGAGLAFCFDPRIGGDVDASRDDAGDDASQRLDAAPSDAGPPDSGDPCFGRLDCDADPTDCETDVLSDPLHCGTCTRRCPARPSAEPACTLGECDIACAPGFLDCDEMDVTGCEVDGSIDPSSCGACDMACPATDPVCARGDCYPLPFPSDGSELDFHATSDVVLPAGRHDFTSFVIDAGVRVTTSGVGVLDIRVTGAVVIDGTLDVSGARGGALLAGSCTIGGANSGGGATGDVLGVGEMSVNSATCRAAGVGGSGSNGTSASGCGMGGAFGGGAGGGRQGGGGGGGGYAGGGGGGNETVTVAARAGGDGASVPGFGAGGAGGITERTGGGGGEPTLLAPLAGADAGLSTCGPGGGGGGSIGMRAALDLAVTDDTFYAGSGGGGGGGNYCEGGGGGGGGGGAVRIASATSITISSTGHVLADGGAGAGIAGQPAGGGGGGSGGVVFLSSPTLIVDGEVSADGGAGGASACTSSRGGRGGQGRVRLSVLPEHCELRGAWSHAFVDGCMPTTTGSVAGSVYIDAYPF